MGRHNRQELGLAVILLDTQVLLWMLWGDTQLGRQARESVELGLREQTAAVSAMSFWEVAMLQEKGRVALLVDVSSWREGLIRDGLVEIPINGEIAIRANQLPGFHSDPADRLIAATALLGDHTLITSRPSHTRLARSVEPVGCQGVN